MTDVSNISIISRSRNFKIKDFDVVLEWDVSKYVIGLSLEWYARRRRLVQPRPGGPVASLPACLDLNVNLPFCWFNISIEKGEVKYYENN